MDGDLRAGNGREGIAAGEEGAERGVGGHCDREGDTGGGGIVEIAIKGSEEFEEPGEIGDGKVDLVVAVGDDETMIGGRGVDGGTWGCAHGDSPCDRSGGVV